MKIKKFTNKKIITRPLSKKDLKRAKKFQIFINSLIEEDVQILPNKKYSLQEEREWLEKQSKNIKNSKAIFLVAEYKNEIIGTASIDLGANRQSHVGNFEITIKEGYRGMGLGGRLMNEIIKLAEKELKPKPKIIKLSVFSTNRPAIALYKKQGFKKVATIPKQIKYKEKLIDETIMLLYLS